MELATEKTMEKTVQLADRANRYRHGVRRLGVVLDDQQPHARPLRTTSSSAVDLDRHEASIWPPRLTASGMRGAAGLLPVGDRRGDVAGAGDLAVAGPDDHVAALQALVAGVGGALDALDHHAARDRVGRC